MTKQEQFFYDNAGFGYDPKHETEKQGKLRCAREMAIAETRAKQEGFSFAWEPELEACDCEDAGAHSHEFCACFDSEMNLITSLGGICGASREYRRVVEAELACDALVAA